MAVCEKLARGYFRHLVDRIAAADPPNQLAVEELYSRLAQPRAQNRKLNARIVDKAYRAFRTRARQSLCLSHYQPMGAKPAKITVHMPFVSGHRYKTWENDSEAVNFELHAVSAAPKETTVVSFISPSVFGTHAYRRLLMRKGASDALDALHASHDALPAIALWGLALLERRFPETYIDLLAPARNGLFCGTISSLLPGSDVEIPNIIRHGRTYERERPEANRILFVTSTFLDSAGMTPERQAAVAGLRSWMDAHRKEIDAHHQDLALVPLVAPPTAVLELAHDLAAEATRLGIPELFQSWTRKRDLTPRIDAAVPA
ncbi:hypothetical protein CKO28_01410 [Rhodovibrio sodomensis]|uniref:Uncharacterized protein n=1 Tax=Rhodovibrio sodomensis TaxID=1088 RepID=A0ABS1D8H3_9PROT|nr:hypothetical protein [Rhodovibrio sodomensis]MBK1666702.1 hypothetical protein [Rhodovibrio sodomensis]